METKLRECLEPQIFLSYSHSDSAIVHKIAHGLIDAGLKCWIDCENLRVGDQYNPIIFEAIEKSQFFIVFLSKSYINKIYCGKEFSWAYNHNLYILPVCIDDITEHYNDNCGYFFALHSGENIIGYNIGIKTDEDIKCCVKKILEAQSIQRYRKFLDTGNMEDLPSLTLPQQIKEILYAHLQLGINNNNNYFCGDVRRELYPALKIEEHDDENIIYPNNDDISLVTFIKKIDFLNQNKHIFITAEGGMGKTVSLLKTCDYFLNIGINAIYISLTNINYNSNLNLENYIKEIVFQGKKYAYNIFDSLVTLETKSLTNMVLILDGLNELPLSYVESLINELRQKILQGRPKVKIIISSRSVSREVENVFHNVSLYKVKLLPLDERNIICYLNSQNICLPPIDLFVLLRSPLILSLYCNTEEIRKDPRYRDIDWINIEDSPNTVGKIFNNFFQTQLSIAYNNVNYNKAAHFILLECFLPFVAYKMTINQENGYDVDYNENFLYDCYESMVEDENEEEKNEFYWYKKDRLNRIKGAYFNYNEDTLAGELIALATEQVHLLCMRDNEYQFLHPLIKDYFVAQYIANDLLFLHKKKGRIKKFRPAIQNKIWSTDILQLVADILREEKSSPILTNSEWKFPNGSKSESVLEIWRNHSDDDSRFAVANLLTILRLGRKGNLANLNLSNLDLRSCTDMDQCKFVEWFKEKYYPCNFQGAYINKNFFFTEGHNSLITAIVNADDELFFSGDASGNVKCFALSNFNMLFELNSDISTVIDLAYDKINNRLAVLYNNKVFIYAIQNCKVKFVVNYVNENLSVDYKYVKFLSNGKVVVSYKLQPEIWYDLEGNRITDTDFFSTPAVSTAYHPKVDAYIRSNLFQMLSIIYKNPETNHWRFHEELIKSRDVENEELIKSGKTPRRIPYLKLRSFGVNEKANVKCIRFNTNGDRFVVAIGNSILEFDYNTLSLTNRRDFEGQILCVNYTVNNMLIVGRNMDLFLLDKNFNVKNYLKGGCKEDIRILKGLDNFLYVVGDSGTIKKLNDDFVVQNIRRRICNKKFSIIEDKLTKKKYMFFASRIRNNSYDIYDYETASIQSLGWTHRIIEDYTEDSNYKNYYKESFIYTYASDIRNVCFNNYKYLHIFKCFFKDIKGELAEEKYINIIVQNGGTVK